MNRGARARSVAFLCLLLLIALPSDWIDRRVPPDPPRRFRLDLNLASAEELAWLPGIGIRRALAIVAERERRSGFREIAELEAVQGIGEATVGFLGPWVQVGRGGLGPARSSMVPRLGSE